MFLLYILFVINGVPYEYISDSPVSRAVCISTEQVVKNMYTTVDSLEDYEVICIPQREA